TMTSFYMFRALFLTFWGDFRGWKITAGAHAGHAAHAGEGHADESHPHPASEGHHGHGHAEEGPEPHESPWPMTWPLSVRGFLALSGRFSTPGLPGFPKGLPLMDHGPAPVFERGGRFVKEREGPLGRGVTAVPGVVACLVGGIGAYFAYVMKNGAPVHEL